MLMEGLRKNKYRKLKIYENGMREEECRYFKGENRVDKQVVVDSGTLR